MNKNFLYCMALVTLACSSVTFSRIDLPAPTKSSTSKKIVASKDYSRAMDIIKTDSVADFEAFLLERLPSDFFRQALHNHAHKIIDYMIQHRLVQLDGTILAWTALWNHNRFNQLIAAFMPSQALLTQAVKDIKFFAKVTPEDEAKAKELLYGAGALSDSEAQRTSPVSNSPKYAPVERDISQLNSILRKDDVRALQSFITANPHFDWDQVKVGLPWTVQRGTPLVAAVWLGAKNCVAYLLDNNIGQIRSYLHTSIPSANGKKMLFPLDYAQDLAINGLPKTKKATPNQTIERYKAILETVKKYTV